MAQSMKPKARADELVVRDMDDEVLVYDLAKDEAITLNPFAAAVWRACDGRRDIDGLVGNVQQRLPRENVAETSVWRALEMLSRCDLLDGPVSAPLDLARRDLMRTLGLGAAAVPIVAMIAVPTPAQAASCGCATPGNCLTKTSCPSTMNCNPGHQCAP